MENNLLALAVEAARARATLGEISAAMEDSFDRYGTQPTPVKGVYGAPYKDDSRWKQVLDGVQAVERRLGRKSKLLVAKMGQDGHDRGANIIASAFGDMGFDVALTRFHRSDPAGKHANSRHFGMGQNPSAEGFSLGRERVCRRDRIGVS